MKSLKVRNWNILLISVLFLSAGCNPSQPSESSMIIHPKYKKAIAESEPVFENYLLTTFTPGASVSVSVDGEIVWSQGLGYASKELQAPATRNTKYRIGQTAEMFTSYVLLQLKQDKKLQLDSSYYTYIPNFPKFEYDFTPAMLGAHTAGFPVTNNREYENIKVKSLKDYVKQREDLKMVYQPGTYSQKSDFGTALLGIMAEQITQTNYMKLFRDLIDTLHLENTLIDYPQMVIENRSENYDLDFIARLVNAREVDLSSLLPMNGVVSTADDLNKAAQVVLQTGLLTEESLDLLKTQRVVPGIGAINRSFCWYAFKDDKQRTIVGQLGSTIGGSSMILVYPDQKLVVSICANLRDEMSEIPAMPIANKFLEIIDPK